MKKILWRGLLVTFLFNLQLHAEIDMQEAFYDAADDMRRFDEKLNQLIDEHNGVDFNDEESDVFDSDIEDFEETEDGYLLERTIKNSENTKIEVELVDRLITLSVTVKTSDSDKTNNSISYESSTTTTDTSLYVPSDAKLDTMQDSYENGILKITFQKK